MSDEIKNVEATEESFEEMLEKSFKTLNTGEKVTGIVTAIGPTEVQVDLGCKQAGYISVDELSADPNVKPEDVVKVGDEIETYIIRVNDVEGYAMLSKKRLDAVKVWEDIEKAREEKTTLEGKVTEENKGGIVVNVKGVRVFVPASQSGLPRGAELSTMIGQTVSLRITEVNRARRRVVGSIKAVTYEARQAAQAEIWNNIEVGKHYTGTVKSMTSYGVFVDIGGVDGMVHISELSWSRIKNPAEVVSVGDTLDVYVISFDPEKHKICQRMNISKTRQSSHSFIDSGIVLHSTRSQRIKLCVYRVVFLRKAHEMAHNVQFRQLRQFQIILAQHRRRNKLGFFYRRAIALWRHSAESTGMGLFK